MRVAKNSRRRRKEEEEEEEEIEEEEEKEEAAAAAAEEEEESAAAAVAGFGKFLSGPQKKKRSQHLQIRTHVRFKNRITIVSTSRKNACAIPPPPCNRITPHPPI